MSATPLRVTTTYLPHLYVSQQHICHTSTCHNNISATPLRVTITCLPYLFVSQQHFCHTFPCHNNTSVMPFRVCTCVYTRYENAIRLRASERRTLCSGMLRHCTYIVRHMLICKTGSVPNTFPGENSLLLH